jgi:membrane-associated phospholipid phosphatase
MSLVTLDVAAQSDAPRYTFDTDILMLRNSIDPDFRHHYDDWTQYAPAAVMVGLKTCGYKGRSTWGRMLVSDAFSVAAMAAMVNGVKYSVQRLRPDESAYNSFPSGHTATAFMTATMLHKEYEGISPWFSIGGYTLATLTGVSRVLNNRHWLTDVLAGAAIGIGSVHLGYFITDKIFKDKQLNPAYEAPEFYYDPTVRHYVAEILFGRRFVIGAEGRKAMGVIPQRGSLAGVQIEVPVIPGLGVCARGTASGMIYNGGICSDLYTVSAGAYWNLHFAKILEFQAKAMAGWARMHQASGADLSGGISLSIITDNNFKIKAFGEFDSVSLSNREPWINTFIAGFSTGFFW